MRRRLLRTALALACLCAALVCGVPAARAAEGTITGTIAGQAGATGIGGTPVVLEIGIASGAKPEERTTSARDDGTFRFEGVPLTSDAIYLLKVVYAGGNYFIEVTFDNGATAADAGIIDVFPASRDAAALSFPRLNTIVSTVDQNGAAIVETGAFRNDATGAYIGPPGAQDATSLRFGLPVGAAGLQLAQGLNRNTVVQLDEAPLLGFASIEAVPPGEAQFAYIYRMQPADGTLEIDRVFPYLTGLYTLYLPAGAHLTSGGTTIGLRDSGEQTLQNGSRYRVYTANNVPAGARLTARFGGVSAGGGGLNPLLPMLALFALVLGVGLIIVYGRNRATSPAAAASRQVKTVPGGVNAARRQQRAGGRAANGRAAPEDPAARKERLLLELVELDERYEAGDLEEAEYRRLRQARKDRLVATLRALKEADPDAVADEPARRP